MHPVRAGSRLYNCLQKECLPIFSIISSLALIAITVKQWKRINQKKRMCAVIGTSFAGIINISLIYWRILQATIHSRGRARIIATIPNPKDINVTDANVTNKLFQSDILSKILEFIDSHSFGYFFSTCRNASYSYLKINSLKLNNFKKNKFEVLFRFINLQKLNIHFAKENKPSLVTLSFNKISSLKSLSLPNLFLTGFQVRELPLSLEELQFCCEQDPHVSLLHINNMTSLQKLSLTSVIPITSVNDKYPQLSSTLTSLDLTFPAISSESLTYFTSHQSITHLKLNWLHFFSSKRQSNHKQSFVGSDVMNFPPSLQELELLGPVCDKSISMLHQLPNLHHLTLDCFQVTTLKSLPQSLTQLSLFFNQGNSVASQYSYSFYSMTHLNNLRTLILYDEELLRLHSLFLSPPPLNLKVILAKLRTKDVSLLNSQLQSLASSFYNNRYGWGRKCRLYYYDFTKKAPSLLKKEGVMDFP